MFIYVYTFSGHPIIAKGSIAEENHVSNTSSSLYNLISDPYLFCTIIFASFSVRAIIHSILPSIVI